MNVKTYCEAYLIRRTALVTDGFTKAPGLGEKVKLFNTSIEKDPDKLLI